MYSKQSWGGDVDPFILTKIMKSTPEGDEDPLVSLVMYEWRDEDLVGVWPSADAAKVGEIHLRGRASADSWATRRKKLFAMRRMYRQDSAKTIRSANLS